MGPPNLCNCSANLIHHALTDFEQKNGCTQLRRRDALRPRFISIATIFSSHVRAVMRDSITVLKLPHRCATDLRCYCFWCAKAFRMIILICRLKKGSSFQKPCVDTSIGHIHLFLSYNQILISPLTHFQVLENLSHMEADDGLFESIERPGTCPRDLYDLMRECWRRDPLERPSFSEIHMFLQRKSLHYATT